MPIPEAALLLWRGVYTMSSTGGVYGQYVLWAVVIHCLTNAAACVLTRLGAYYTATRSSMLLPTTISTLLASGLFLLHSSTSSPSVTSSLSSISPSLANLHHVTVPSVDNVTLLNSDNVTLLTSNVTAFDAENLTSLHLQDLSFLWRATSPVPETEARNLLNVFCLPYSPVKNSEIAVLVVSFFLWLLPFLLLRTRYLKPAGVLFQPEQENFLGISYHGVCFDQDLFLNYAPSTAGWWGSAEGVKRSRVFLCTTMYREADYEMKQLLRSLSRVSCTLSCLGC
jgi:hypothetical protein